MLKHLVKKPDRKRTPGSARTIASTNRQSETNHHKVALWTVGHSTRPVGEFIALLRAHGIQQLIDVRTIPRSRHNPQFNQDQLPRSLKQAGIRYLHLPGLGGLRRARRDSVNTAWRNTSFRGFADYMQTLEFEVALNELIRLAHGRRTAIMCAEAVPWRCHRSLIADALLVRGLNVEEITSETGTRPHTLTPWSRVAGQRITYPAVQAPQGNKVASGLSRAHTTLDGSSAGGSSTSLRSADVGERALGTNTLLRDSRLSGMIKVY